MMNRTMTPVLKKTLANVLAHALLVLRISFGGCTEIKLLAINKRKQMKW